MLVLIWESARIRNAKVAGSTPVFGITLTKSFKIIKLYEFIWSVLTTFYQGFSDQMLPSWLTVAIGMLACDGL